MAFSGTSGLYLELVNHRGARWQVASAGCRGLAGTLARAQGVLARQEQPEEALVTAARGALELGARGSSAVARLCRCFEDSHAAGAAPGGFSLSYIPTVIAQTRAMPASANISEKSEDELYASRQ